MAAVVLLLAGAGAGQPGGLLLYPVGDGGQALGLGGVVGQGLPGLLQLLGVGLAGELVALAVPAVPPAGCKECYAQGGER